MLKPVLYSLMLLASAPVLAESQSSPHSIGLTLGGGSAKFKGSKEDGNGVGHFYLYYHYNLNEQFGVEAGVIGGAEASNWDCKKIDRDNVECSNNRKPIFGIGADDLEYSSLVMAGTAKYPLSERNSIYGKLGLQYFDYELSSDKTKLADDSGVGLYLEAGWQYRWDSGWGMNVGLKHIPMDDLKMNSMDVGVSYRF